jgi:hypothetical protein
MKSQKTCSEAKITRRTTDSRNFREDRPDSEFKSDGCRIADEA